MFDYSIATVMDNSSSNYSLSNLDNYKSIIEDKLDDIIEKYCNLIAEYIIFIIDNTNFKNTNYEKFIIERGFETITHVFKMLLYYSRNLDVAYYHGQKAFYFYVEFIGQISEDKNTFLQLTSRDSTMFVYKKTIFEMNNEVRKNVASLSQENVEQLELLSLISVIIKKTMIFLSKYDAKTLKTNTPIICDKIRKIILKPTGYKILEKLLEFMNKELSREKYIEIIDSFIIQYAKVKPDMQISLTEKMLRDKFDNELFEKKMAESPKNFIKWLLY
jgi:hypothetical protein